MNWRAFRGSGMNIFLNPCNAVPSNTALVTDACVAALRAFYSAAQRER
jgi:hypothetical protein